MDDLSVASITKKYSEYLKTADLIFLDAEKDGVMESNFLKNFESIPFESNPLLLFDDIRLWNMLGVWRSIKLPKMDLTSFGHWSIPIQEHSHTWTVKRLSFGRLP